MDVQRQDDQLEPTYSSSVPIRFEVLRTCRKQWTIGRGGERGSGISVLIMRDDDDDEYGTKRFCVRFKYRDVIWFRVSTGIYQVIELKLLLDKRLIPQAVYIYVQQNCGWQYIRSLHRGFSLLAKGLTTATHVMQNSSIEMSTPVAESAKCKQTNY